MRRQLHGFSMQGNMRRHTSRNAWLQKFWQSLIFAGYSLGHQFPDISYARSHIPEGLGLEAGPLDGKNDLYIYIYVYTWILVVPGEERAEEGATTREKVDREICVPEPMYLSLRI